MFYKETVTAIKLALPNVQGQLHPEAKGKEHLIWMCAQIESWPETVHNALKAARWIGWMLRDIEGSYDIGWTNEMSRRLVRTDVSSANDMPKVIRPVVRYLRRYT